MSRRFLPIVMVFLAGGLCTLLAPARPPDAARAMSAFHPLIVIAPADPEDRMPVNLRFRPEPSPTPTPRPTPSPAPKAALRPATTLRPIPVPVVDAREIALVNLDTGRFLWEVNSREVRAPASLTKIFTAMVAVDRLGLNAIVTVPASITQLPGDSTLMGLSPGERVTVRELLYGLFLKSGNDAAETLATATTTRAGFISAMNAKAAGIGLRATHFNNPTGLDEAGHYSTAHDLAVASLYLESHYGSLVSIAATPSITIAATATHKTYALVSLDKLLWTYPGTYGLKTGWTESALGCLITTSSRGGHRLLAVLLGAPNGTAYAEMPKVLDYGFQVLGVLPRPAGS